MWGKGGLLSNGILGWTWLVEVPHPKLVLIGRGDLGGDCMEMTNPEV
jgi:hypothetical protein